MSRRRKPNRGNPDRGRLSPQQAAMARILGPLDGQRIPGGCDYCQAYQKVRPASAGMWLMTVHHADDCPFLRRIEGRAS